MLGQIYYNILVTYFKTLFWEQKGDMSNLRHNTVIPRLRKVQKSIWSKTEKGAWYVLSY